MFKASKILVFGDSMIDTYLWGTVHRNSPEANVPIVAVDGMEHRLGGAANVALNLKELGAQVDLMSIIGNDILASIFSEQLVYEGISDQNLLIIQDRKTTSKTRIYNGDLYVLRYDDEIVDDLFKEDEEVVIHLFNDYIQKEQPELVLYQDYNKGMLTKKVIRETLAICKKYNIKTAVDPKRNNFFEYKGVTLFKPNLKEVKEALNITTADKKSIHEAAVDLKQKLEATKILITLSENGALILEDEIISVNAIPRNIVDVSGAGDSVIAVASMCLVNNFDNQKILAYSNIAGGMVCEKAGVVSINLEALKKEIELQSK